MPATSNTGGKGRQKPTDAEQVNAYMANPGLLFKNEINAVRKIILNVNKAIGERIKWKAPSYYYQGEDIVTFNAWAVANVHLVFHHPGIVKIQSPILEGSYKDRRMVYFTDRKSISQQEAELTRVITALLRLIDAKKTKPTKK